MIVQCSQNPLNITKYQNDKEVSWKACSKIHMSVLVPCVHLGPADICGDSGMKLFCVHVQVMDVFNKISELFPGMTGAPY